MNIRINELDGIRGIAILMVVVHHYVTHQLEEPFEGTLIYYFYLPTTLFWSGVDLFFVLSGFLIGGIILDNHEKENFLKVFWIRRCCRILPVLLLLIFSCWLLKNVLDTERYAWLFDNLLPWWSYLTFSQNILMSLRQSFGGHSLAMSWSLAVEEQFYIVAPMLMLLAGRKFWIQGLIPLIVLALILRLLIPGFHTYMITPFRMDALLAGVLVAVLFRNQTAWKAFQEFKSSIALGVAGLAIATGCLAFKDFNLLKYSWFALFYASFLLTALLYRDSRITYPLRFRPLCFFGGIAYGLYMYHQTISGLMHGWLRDGAPPSLHDSTTALVTIAAFLASVTTAWMSFQLYERYFLSIGKQWRYGTNAARATARPVVADV